MHSGWIFLCQLDYGKKYWHHIQETCESEATTHSLFKQIRITLQIQALSFTFANIGGVEIIIKMTWKLGN